jgi:N-acetylgalactosamine 4-sulfate 6-O-sulfotransferase
VLKLTRMAAEGEGVDEIAAAIRQTIPRRFCEGHRNPCWRTADRGWRCLPYFYILGMPKCATTDLFRRLQLHPHIFCGSRQKKEPYFWTRGSHFRADGIDANAYVDNFEELAATLEPHLITGEASVQTFWENRNEVLIPDLIHEFQPEARLVVIFRNPTARAHSEYRYTNADAAPTTVDALLAENLASARALAEPRRRALFSNDPVLKGLYVSYLKEWLQRFPARQLLVLSFEEYRQAPRTVLERLFQHLEVPQPGWLRWRRILIERRRNASRNRACMSEALRTELDAFYRPYNQELLGMLERYDGPRSALETFHYP